MPRFKDFVPNGVIPACLLPFNEDLGIDEAGYRKHLRDVAGVQGLSAITVNAHASEVHACTLEEQERVAPPSAPHRDRDRTRENPVTQEERC